jgi:hypothetical protein
MKFSQVRLAPFEAAIALLIVVQSVIAFGEWSVVDPIAVLLPTWLRLTFNASYGIAGLLILAGMVWWRGDVEGAGLILFAATVAARGFLFGYLFDWSAQSVTSLAFSLVFAGAALARISLLRTKAAVRRAP